MKIQKPGVNYCHCPCCHTEFFFNSKDISSFIKSTHIPMVVCPYCGDEIIIGYWPKHFTYKKTEDEEYQ